MSDLFENVALLVALMLAGISTTCAVLAVFVYWLETSE